MPCAVPHKRSSSFRYPKLGRKQNYILFKSIDYQALNYLPKPAFCYKNQHRFPIYFENNRRSTWELKIFVPLYL